MKKKEEIFCKECEYFEDKYKRRLSAPGIKNIFKYKEVPYGICNNIQNKEYREVCWEYYYCMNGKKIRKCK